MSDEIWKRDEVTSPCVKICVIHPETRICSGCLRTIDEITDWTRMGADKRDEIMAALPSRTVLLNQRRGGRAARLARS